MKWGASEHEGLGVRVAEEGEWDQMSLNVERYRVSAMGHSDAP